MGRRTAEAQRLYRERKRLQREAVKQALDQAAAQETLPLDPNVAAELARPEELPWHGRREGKWRDKLIRAFGNPLVEEAKVMATPLPVLASRLDCSLLEAEDRRHRARAFVAGYVIPKVPSELNVEAGGGSGFAINIRLDAPEQGELIDVAAEEVDDAD